MTRKEKTETRLHQLERIKEMGWRYHHNQSPRNRRAVLIGIWTFLVIEIAFLVIDLWVGGGLFAVFTISALIIALVVGCVDRYRSRLSATYAEPLYDRLAGYDPLCPDAYRNLQSKAQKDGYLSDDALHEFLACEFNASNEQRDHAPTKKRFLDRTL